MNLFGHFKSFCEHSLCLSLCQVWADEDQNLQRISYWGELNQFFLNGTGTGCQVNEG